MSQERLNGLATLSIEKDMLADIDVDVLINDLFLKMFEEITSYKFLNKKNVLMLFY
jgi:hypothetical protein